jgi:NACHT domain
VAVIVVNQKVFQRLKHAYSERFGSSPNSIRERIDLLFNHELGDKNSIISDKTIRNFFKSEFPTKTQEKNLNYLCFALLDCNSYQEAVQQFGQVDVNVRQDFLESYGKDCIEQKCGTIRVPEMTEPRSLRNLYTTARISEDLRKNQRKSASELRAELEGERLPQQQETWVEALEAANKHSKLMIWGKAGAGKTTFLKYLALRFLEEYSEKQAIPVFISLNSFAEDLNQSGLKEAILQEFIPYILENTVESKQIEAEKLTTGLLEQGKCLILLDGFDEVLETKVSQVYQAIESSIKRYPQNRFIITCRFGAKRSVPTSEFKEVEIVNFSQVQITNFVYNWFRKNNDKQITNHEAKIAKKFLQKLDENLSIAELATNPLLLTMLCLIYENGYQFPKDRISLYDDATDLLLRTWDSWRRIDRDVIYKGKLTRNRRKSLFAQIAYQGFSQTPQRCFWQHRDLDIIIQDFILNIPGVEAETLEVDSQEILKAIESQHGLIVESAKDIYSFSCWTFQEYFTACYLAERIDNSSFITETIQKYLNHRKWRQVWLIFVELLRTPDSTNMFLREAFIYANSLVKRNNLQKVLAWLARTTQKVDVSSSSWRACYIAFDLESDLHINREIKFDRILAQKLSEQLRAINKKRKAIKDRTDKCKLELDLVVIHALAMDRFAKKPSNLKVIDKYDKEYTSDLELQFQGTIDLARQENLNELADRLSNLQSRKPSEVSSETASIPEWEVWAKDLQSIMSEYLDIGYELELVEKDIRDFENYLYAILLIVECLQGDIVCSSKLREQILDHLLLPNDLLPAKFQSQS